MTDKQREAIDRLNEFKTIKILYGNNFVMHTEELKKVQEAIGVVLYMLIDSVSKEEIQNMIEKIINETTPTPVFKPKSLWTNIDYERLYKTEPLYDLIKRK